MAAQYAANREQVLARRKAFYEGNPDKKFDNYLRFRYSIDSAEYRRLLDLQGGVCGICHQHPTAQRLAVDHDHRCCPGGRSCGQCIRGLLCMPCNRHVGYFEKVGVGLTGYLSRGNPWQEAVREFHSAMGVTVGATPAIREPQLRAALIAEEAAETVEAIEANDLVGAVDGLCDVLYVVLGTAISFGIDLDPFFAEVHRTNMAKLDGPVRADGKRLKPVGWQPPRIAEMLQAARRDVAE